MVREIGAYEPMTRLGVIEPGRPAGTRALGVGSSESAIGGRTVAPSKS